MKGQKEAVYEATRAVLKENGILFEDGQDVRKFINDDIKGSIIAIIVSGFNAKEITLSDKFDLSKLEAYTKGMISNWFRKDKRLNGGTVHRIANPGSRAGSSDPQVKEMKKLLSLEEIQADASIVEKIKTSITERVNAIKKDKVKKSVVINADDLPEEFRGLINK